MSNTTVGSVYQQVMKDVIESSRVDFEEGGVDESVLEELSKGWQKKLSELKIAQFPWDPKPEPPAAPTQAIQNMNYQSQDMNTPPSGMSQSNLNMPNMNLPQMPQMNNGPRIKSEPGLDQNGNNAQPPQFQPPQVQAPPGMTAHARAAFNLEQSYGQRAAGSINALQSAMPQQQQPKIEPGMQPQQQMQMQNGQQQMQRPQMTEQQYKLLMAQRARQSIPGQQGQQGQPGPQNGVNNAQTDGAGDEPIGVLKSVDANGEMVEMGRVEIDNMIRKRIEAMGRSMEGGGLMLPLKEHKPSGRSKSRKVAPVNGESLGSKIPQLDGGDSDDDLKDNVELDEDAINSDLDDPDDGLNEDDDEEDDKANVMLCMYDKVQRVKNKWKCVMKDGVITINQKEYVFHKASGEYEW